MCDHDHAYSTHGSQFSHVLRETGINDYSMLWVDICTCKLDSQGHYLYWDREQMQMVKIKGMCVC